MLRVQVRRSNAFAVTQAAEGISMTSHRIKTTPFTDDYDIQEEVLGAGTFSECRKALQKQTGKVFAVKIIDKSKRRVTHHNTFRHIDCCPAH
jgi:hypothetical protein